MTATPDRPFAYVESLRDLQRKKKSEIAFLGITGTATLISVAGIKWATNEISRGSIPTESLLDMAQLGMLVVLGAINTGLNYVPISTIRVINREMWLRSLINSGQIIEAPSQALPSPEPAQGSPRPTFLQTALSAPKRLIGGD